MVFHLVASDNNKLNGKRHKHTAVKHYSSSHLDGSIFFDTQFNDEGFQKMSLTFFGNALGVLLFICAFYLSIQTVMLSAHDNVR